jgi:septum formation protein
MPILIAKAKASALIKRHDLLDLREPALLVTCDQIVLYKTSVREKPESREEAVEFLSSYSNDAVSTVSAIVVTHLPSGVQESGVDIATVYWKDISTEVVERVVERGDVMQSAGGFIVEDEDLNPLVKGIDRPVDSVMGLPVDLLRKLIGHVLHNAEAAEEAKSEHKCAHK